MTAWYVAGPLIGFVFFIFLFIGKSFGISSALKTTCALVPGLPKWEYFRVKQKEHLWRYVFITGSIIGGGIGAHFSGESLVPSWVYNGESLSQMSYLWLGIGGFLVGFGVRYAGGCTSGHAITGLSFLQWRSLVAVIGFFLGGLAITHFYINKVV